MTSRGRPFRPETSAIVEGQGSIIAQGHLGTDAAATLRIPSEKFEIAQGGEPVVIYSPSDDRIRGLALLDQRANMFVYTERVLDPRVIAHGVDVVAAAQEYEKIQGQRGTVLTTFSLIFVIVALLLLFAAIWLAMMLATRLAEPISRLVTAAGRIGAGDLGTRVPEDDQSDESGVLSRAFN